MLQLELTLNRGLKKGAKPVHLPKPWDGGPLEEQVTPDELAALREELTQRSAMRDL